MIYKKNHLLDIIFAGIIAVFLIILIRILFFQVFVIHSDSMSPTLQKGDTILVFKLPFYQIKVTTNDIIIFNVYNKSFVKRVVAIEYDEVVIKNGSIFINQKENISSVKYEFDKKENYSNIIEKNNIYVLGDNISNSVDSRNFGTIMNERIIGKVILIFSPLSRISILL